MLAMKAPNQVTVIGLIISREAFQMGAHEDLQYQLAEDVIAQAQSAKRWRGLVQSGGGSAAEKYARDSYKTFSKLLMEDYIAHGCYQLPEASSPKLDDRIFVEIQKVGKILDRYADPADTALGKRLKSAEIIHSNSNDSADDRFLARTVRQLNMARRDDWRTSNAEGDFTPEIVRNLLDSAYNIKRFSREYVYGVGALLARDNVNESSVSDHTEITTSPANGSIGLRRGSSGLQRGDGAGEGLHYHPALGQRPASNVTASQVVPSVEDWVDKLPEYRYVPLEGSSPDYGPRSPRPEEVISHTPVALLASDTAELATPVSANPDKRRRERSGAEGAETPSAKRRQLANDRPASARSI